MFQIFVAGEPKPQGSKTAYVRGGRAVLVEANKSLPGWRVKVEKALADERDAKGLEMFSGAVEVQLEFYLTRPRTNKREFMTTKPDVDKLARGILDCLVRQRYLVDDSYVISLAAVKAYAADGQLPGVNIKITNR